MSAPPSDNPDDLLFFDDDAESLEAVPERPSGPPWRVLVVDDEPSVQIMTRLALEAVRFRDRPIELIEAHSGAQAFEVLRREPDIALAFIDVVMETDSAGLDLVRRVREELGNQTTRLILRTGQPGQAPESKVIVAYDINDYKAKTELTHQKLFSCTIAALRGYEHVVALEDSRRGLRRIIEVTSELFRLRTLRSFAAGVLSELTAMTGAAPGGLVCGRAVAGTSAADLGVADLSVLAATAPPHGHPGATDGDPAALVLESLRTQASRYDDHHLVLHILSPGRHDYAVYLPGTAPVTSESQFLIDMFLSKVSVGFDTRLLWEQLRAAHKATVVALVDVAEGRDSDTGDHVLRVAEISERIARQLREKGHYRDQLDETFLEHVGIASMLHDVGKVAIPDRILLKPGPLDPEERAIMETHAATGGQMLTKAAAMVHDNTYLRLGRQIAHCHHEWFDGTGYPQKLSGQDIPLSARIAALADVFDALSHARPYKQPWPLDQTLSHIGALAGRQFDPAVVAALMDALAEAPAPT